MLFVRLPLASVVNYGTLNPADFALRYRLLTEGPVNPATGNPVNQPITDFCKPYTSLDNPTLTEAVNPLTWAYDWTTLKFEITLVSARTAYTFNNDGSIKDYDKNDKGELDYEDDETFGEPIIVEINVADLVEFEAVKPVKVQYSKTAPTKANLVGALAVTDVATKAKLYNPYAKQLDHIWAGYYEDKTGGATLESYKTVLQVYDQTVTAEADKDIEVYFNGELVADPHQVVPYTYDAKTGEITLTATNIERGEFKFVVDVTLNHKYNDYGTHGHAVKAEVIFTSEAVEDDVVDVNLPKPAGQWVFNNVEIGYEQVMDFGNNFIIGTIVGKDDGYPEDMVGKAQPMANYAEYTVVPTTSTEGYIKIHRPSNEDDPNAWFPITEATLYVYYTDFDGSSMNIYSPMDSDEGFGLGVWESNYVYDENGEIVTDEYGYVIYERKLKAAYTAKKSSTTIEYLQY